MADDPQQLKEIEVVAFRRLITRLTDAPEEEVDEMNAIQKVDAALDRVESLEEENRYLRQEVDQHEARLEAFADIADQKTSKEQKIAAIVQYGENLRGSAEKWNITAKEIRGATGVTRRYSYDLIEDLAESFEWAEVREPQEKPSAKDGGSTIQWKKAVRIDYAALHTDQEAVNKFTTDQEATA